MGCLCFKPTSERPQERSGDRGLELSLRRRSGTKSLELEAVRDLVLVQGQNGHPSASLQWKPPANLPSTNDVSHYCIMISSGVSSQVLREIRVEAGRTRLDFPADEHLEPLQECVFAVQAVGSNRIAGDLNMLDGVIDWQCRFPGCERNRLKLEDRIYDFCTRDHKIEFDEGHCLYGDCREIAAYEDPSSPNTTHLVRRKCHFCTYDHYYRILKTVQEPDVVPGFFIEVKSSSPEYKTVEELFHKSWSSKQRKTPPSLSLVLAVINPSLERSYQEYKQLCIKSEKEEAKMVKKVFYGTNLGCDLHTYQVPCRRVASTECSLCELAVHGFGRLCTSSGAGVTLNCNPAWSHDKAKVHADSRMYGLLMCEVACTKSKKLVRSVSDSRVPSEGFDSVKVNVKSGPSLKKSTDEVIVYKADAVCPRYILLYVHVHNSV